MNLFKFFIILFICLYQFLNPNTSNAITNLKVGAYIFPPYLNNNINSQEPSGLTIELIKLLNRIQSEYKFEYVPTSSKRRFQDLQDGNFDMIFFEDKNRGWKEFNVTTSKIIVKDEEIYIAKKKEGRDKSFFSDFKNKSFVGIKGYHYSFANFNADFDYLKKNFKMELTSDHEGSIQMILKDRGDIGVVTSSFLNNYLNEHSEVRNEIIISDKPDQIYNLSILMSNKAKIKTEQINNMLTELKNKELLKNIFKNYKLKAN